MSQQSDIAALKRQVEDLSIRLEQFARMLADGGPPQTAVFWIDLTGTLSSGEGSTVAGNVVAFDGTTWTSTGESITARCPYDGVTGSSGDRACVVRTGDNQFVLLTVEC